MIEKIHLGKSTLALSLALFLLTAIIVFPNEVEAESWIDNFDGGGSLWDARWTKGGYGALVVDDDSYLTAVSFTADPEYANGWHGPYLRTNLSLTGNFNITAVIKCIAETSPDNLARVEVRLFDSMDNQIYSFGWIDSSVADNKAWIYLNGDSDGDLIFSTGASSTYSVFIDKPLSLVRTSTDLEFYIDGKLKHTATPKDNGLNYLEIGFLTYESFPYCTYPTYFQSVSVITEELVYDPPDAPTNLTCEAGDEHINLTWKEPIEDGGKEITNYKIMRGTASGALSYLTTVGDVLTFKDVGVENGQSYFYTVTAINAVGEGPSSSEVEAVPMSTPKPPTNIEAIAGYDSVTLYWENPLDDGGAAITGYNIYRSQDINAPAFLKALGVANSYNDTTVQNQTTYYYWISSVNVMGESSLSNEVIAETGAIPTPPSKPENLEGKAGDAYIALSWSSPKTNGNSQLLHYSIYRGFEVDNRSLVANVSGNITEFMDTGLVNSQTYHYSVTAVNTIGESYHSSIFEAMPNNFTAPMAPINFTVETGNGLVYLDWLPPSYNGGLKISGYYIYKGDSMDNLTKFSLPIVLTYVDLGLTNDLTYYYAVSAMNAIGEGDISDVLTAIPYQIVRNDTDDSDNTTSDDTNSTSDDSSDTNSTADSFTPGEAGIDDDEIAWTSTFITFIIFIIAGGVGVLYMVKPRSNTSKPEEEIGKRKEDAELVEQQADTKIDER